MTLEKAALWAWRCALLGAVLWAGYELRLTRESMPGDMPRDVVRDIREISEDVANLRTRVGTPRPPGAESCGWWAPCK